MNENLIEELTEEALRGCIHLRVLELRHNRLHEQDIATHAWTRLKYVHPSIHPTQCYVVPSSATRGQPGVA